MIEMKDTPLNALTINRDELMKSLQLGISFTISSMESKPKRDVLMQDFNVVETISFPNSGSETTPIHEYPDFKFSLIAPTAFRYFREIFGIRSDNYINSLCSKPLRELSNPGASGSLFFLSSDDQFIIKSVQKSESTFLFRLLPGYYMNLSQNPRTLLPKFFGLYIYKTLACSYRFIIMNNLIPSEIRMDLKFDLKGSTYKRVASANERAKASPTLKDIDFIRKFGSKGGLILERSTYDALIGTIERDCTVLRSFSIMDYSLLLGIHRENPNRKMSNVRPPFNYLTPTESITLNSTGNPGGIAATSFTGEKLLIFPGIIDILQSYSVRKRMEHLLKSTITEGETISVSDPKFYAERFLKFLKCSVFQPEPGVPKKFSFINNHSEKEVDSPKDSGISWHSTENFSMFSENHSGKEHSISYTLNSLRLKRLKRRIFLTVTSTPL